MRPGTYAHVKLLRRVELFGNAAQNGWVLLRILVNGRPVLYDGVCRLEITHISIFNSLCTEVLGIRPEMFRDLRKNIAVFPRKSVHGLIMVGHGLFFGLVIEPCLLTLLSCCI